MKLILNPWVKMQGYNCFGCSPDNPLGAQMRFYEEDEFDPMGDIVSVWLPTQNHQSWINTLHGGMQATLLDEVCGWVVFKKLSTSGVTAKMEIRYKNSVSTLSGPLILRARLKSANHRVAVVEGELRPLLASENGTFAEGDPLTTCECTYFSFPEEKAREMGFVEAQLAEEDLTLQEVIRQAKQPTYKSLKLKV